MPIGNTLPFSFEISLSVLNHLGRNLYRSFSTILGEAISNSWDADAENVWIILDRQRNRFFVKDDGVGMDRIDFQNKFLKIGYSKRQQSSHSQEGRPYIGRKGIGKLALLSCAERVTVISRKSSEENYVGGIIDNVALDTAITDDVEVSKYSLDRYNLEDYSEQIRDHDHGTIICFDAIKSGIQNTPEFFRKVVALYFKFSIHDPTFRIYIDGSEVSHEDLSSLAEKTQFLWCTDDFDDPYIDYAEKYLAEPPVQIPNNLNFRGFIASVEKPSDRTIRTMQEAAGVDLFVNGRVRAKDILKSISASRITENYLYGQIHYDQLDDDDGIDRFTSGREDIVANDEKYAGFLEEIKSALLPKILKEWDEMRRNHNQDGDDEEASIKKERRRAESLYNTIIDSYHFPKSTDDKKFLKELREAAAGNFGAYANCFVSENLIREYIRRQDADYSSMLSNALQQQKSEQAKKEKCNICISIRERSSDLLTYAGMDELLEITRRTLPDKQRQHIGMEVLQYGVIRNALAHTAILTKEAKQKLASLSDNIKGKVNSLFSQTKENLRDH